MYAEISGLKVGLKVLGVVLDSTLKRWISKMQKQSRRYTTNWGALCLQINEPNFNVRNINVLHIDGSLLQP
jgi:hypothetical protein